MRELTAFVNACREMISRGVPVGEVVANLRRRGLSKIESIKVLVDGAGKTLRDAKEIVHLSETWSDLRAQDDEFHDFLEESFGAEIDAEE